MAANGSGTWAKSKNSAGEVKSVFIPKGAGGNIAPGQTISQSRLNTLARNHGKALAKEGIDAAKKYPGLYAATGSHVAKQLPKPKVADPNPVKNMMPLSNRPANSRPKQPLVRA